MGNVAVLEGNLHSVIGKYTFFPPPMVDHVTLCTHQNNKPQLRFLYNDLRHKLIQWGGSLKFAVYLCVTTEMWGGRLLSLEYTIIMILIMINP